MKILNAMKTIIELLSAGLFSLLIAIIILAVVNFEDRENKRLQRKLIYKLQVLFTQYVKVTLALLGFFAVTLLLYSSGSVVQYFIHLN